MKMHNSDIIYGSKQINDVASPLYQTKMWDQLHFELRAQVEMVLADEWAFPTSIHNLLHDKYEDD